MLNEIEKLKAQAEEVIAAARDVKTLEEVQVQLTGRRSRLREIMSGIGSLPAEQRPAAGKAGGELRSAIENALASRRRQLEENEADEKPRRYSTRPKAGHRQPSPADPRCR